MERIRESRKWLRTGWLVLLAASACVGEGGGLCPDGRTPCGGQCVDLFTDPTNCGGCGATCSQGEFCHQGLCTPDCEDECRTPGEQRCSDKFAAAVATCGQHDDDACLEWGALAPCGPGQTCSNGQCGGGCSDECGRVGETICDEATDGVRSCGDFDDDACLEWSSVSECGAGAICDDGDCINACVEPGDDCRDFDDCCDDPDQGYHCCPIFHICVRDFW